jgi:hypothetical protein
VVVVEVAFAIFAAITDSDGPAEVAATALVIGAVAGIAAPFVLFVTRRRDVLMWSVISVCLTFLALVFGVFVFFDSVVAVCGQGCLG